MTKLKLIEILNDVEGNPTIECNHPTIMLYGISKDSRRPFLITVIENKESK
jgi:hypothetical protein